MVSTKFASEINILLLYNEKDASTLIDWIDFLKVEKL